MIRGLPSRVDALIFRHLWADYRRTLERATVGGVEPADLTLLDVGCGVRTPLFEVAPRFLRSTGLDCYEPALDASRAAALHTDYLCADVLGILAAVGPRSYDVVVAAELIEHLEKEDGWSLLDQMEKVARQRVVVMTPNGFLQQDAHDGNPWQAHRSGWTVAEFEGRGYRVFGANGWRPLRGRLAYPRYRPHGLWDRISMLTQPLVKDRPAQAFHLCAVKEISPKR